MSQRNVYYAEYELTGFRPFAFGSRKAAQRYIDRVLGGMDGWVVKPQKVWRSLEALGDSIGKDWK